MNKKASILDQEIFLFRMSFSLDGNPSSIQKDSGRAGMTNWIPCCLPRHVISLKLILMIAGFVLLLMSCASVQTSQEWEKVKTFAAEHTGVETHWEQTEEDAKVTKEEVNKLLSDGLTEENAVRIAFLNDPKLQAFFEEIAISKADLVQAGLFSNPDLSAVFRFPYGGGDADIEAVGAFKISDFWQIPLRKKVASARLEATMLKVSEEILNTMAEARHAHNEYVALFQIRKETENRKKQMEELRDHLLYRQKFGFTKDIDIYMADAAVLDLEAEIGRIKRDLEVARLRLNRILGLSPEQSGYEVTGKLPDQFRPIPDSETLIAHAFSTRPDLQIAKRQIEESRQVLALERRRIFKDVEAGIAYARDTEGTDFLGPEVRIPLPIFDQNQAQISKAEYKVRHAEKELQNKIGIIREEVSSAFEVVTLARKEVGLIRDQILPIRKSAVEYADKYFNAMQLNMLYLLEARQKLIETTRRYLEALRDHRNQEIELERILGSKIPLPK
ncbi:MAG: TolC family protein [Nitrospirota bacterium]